jgi:hypothetical protein
MLDNEFNYYVAHQAELVRKYDGRFLVIHGSKVAGNYGSLREAYNAGIGTYPPGSFLVHKCGPGRENYTRRMNPAVAF